MPIRWKLVDIDVNVENNTHDAHASTLYACGTESHDFPFGFEIRINKAINMKQMSKVKERETERDMQLCHICLLLITLISLELI